MGKPINKRNFGDTAGVSLGIIANVGSGADTGFILKQSGTNKYLVDIGGELGTVRLVNKSAEALLEGEAIIPVQVGSDTFYAKKITQNRVSVWGNNGDIADYSWKDGEATLLKVDVIDVTDDIDYTATAAFVADASSDTFYVANIFADSVPADGVATWTYNLTFTTEEVGEDPELVVSGTATGPATAFTVATVPDFYNADTPTGTITAVYNGQTVNVVLG